MASINLKKLKEDIKQEDFSRVYYLYGSEKYLLSYYTGKLCECVHKAILTEFNFNKFVETVSVQDIAYAVEALPMMNDKKCVLVEDWPIENMDEDEFNRLKELLESVPSSTVLVFSNSKETKKTPSVRKVLKLFEKYASVLEFKELSKQDISKQLVKWAKSRNCEISLSDANYLMEYSSNDMLSLKNEMEKLCAYCADKQKIEKKDIEELVCRSIDSSVFTMCNAVCIGNISLAFCELDKLLFNKEEPIMIVAVLASFFIDMYRVKAIEKHKKTENELASAFDYGNKTFKLQSARRNSRQFSYENICKIIDMFADTDIKLKSQKGESRIYIEKLLTEIMMLTKQSRRQ